MKAFSHPIHPILVHFPIALLVIATGLDGWLLFSRDASVARLAHLCLASGLAASVPSAAAGFYDAYRLLSKHRDRADNAIAHVGVIFVSLMIYLVRLKLDLAQPALFGISLLGALALFLGGWLGGQMVYREWP